MCTVCGIATDEPQLRNVSRVLGMLRATRHRGPDACGLHADGTTVLADTPEALEAAMPDAAMRPSLILAQSRLTITGSDAARQPFVSRDGKLSLAHNGEVYNHATLAQLVGDAESTSTGSDSEVLMRVLEHHHKATEGRLAEAVRRTVAVASGMYALAATDGEILVLARDGIGKKPLYYVDGAGAFAFASERKALVEVARDEDAAIRRLLPGQILVREPGLPLQIETQERIAAPAIDITDMDVAVDRYEAALRAAIERRTRGLPRAAIFFSGGVDSVMIARLLQQAGIESTGYVVGTSDSSDVEYAVRVAEDIGLPVKVTRVDEDMVEDAMPRILEAAELHGPMMAEVSVPMWFAAKAAHEDGHRVVFTGQAADELFAGYSWYRGVLEKHGHLTLHARLWEDIRALPLDTLEREDRISMAWSLEMRAPFLDAEVIRTAMRISPLLKLQDANDKLGKRPHRLLAHRVGVPAYLADRTKVPAQDGASIHTLLEAIAEKRFPGEAPASDVPDFGSNYRYRDRPGAYGHPKVRALLAAMVEEGGFVVAGEDACAHAPATRVEVEERSSARAEADVQTGSR